MRVSLTLPSNTDEWIRSTQTMTGDLTTFPVDAALLSTDVEEPTEPDWSSAEWSGNDIRWHYLGNLEPGIYTFWVRVNGDTVQPIRPTGLVRLTG